MEERRTTDRERNKVRGTEREVGGGGFVKGEREIGGERKGGRMGGEREGERGRSVKKNQTPTAFVSLQTCIVFSERKANKHQK